MYLRHNVRSVSLLSIVRSVETPDEKKVGFLSSDYLTWISPKSFFYVRKRMIKRPKKKNDFTDFVSQTSVSET